MSILKRLLLPLLVFCVSLVATAAPVVVTPRSLAGFVYFPPGTGGAAAAGGSDVSTLQTCRVMPAAAAPSEAIRPDRTISMASRDWFGYTKPLKVYYILRGGAGGGTAGGGGGSSAILKNGVLVAGAAGGDGLGTVSYGSVGQPASGAATGQTIQGIFEVTNTDTIRVVIGGGGGQGGTGVSGPYPGGLPTIIGGGGGAGYYGGAGGGVALNSGGQSNTMTPHRGGGINAPGAPGLIVSPDGPYSIYQGVSGSGNYGGYTSIGDAGWHTNANAASLTQFGAGGNTRGFGYTGGWAPYPPVGVVQAGGGGRAGFGGGSPTNGWYTSGPFNGSRGIGLTSSDVNPTGPSPVSCHPKAKMRNIMIPAYGGCNSADFDVPPASEGMTLPQQYFGMAGMVLFQYQAPTCGIIPNYDQN